MKRTVIKKFVVFVAIAGVSLIALPAGANGDDDAVLGSPAEFSAINTQEFQALDAPDSFGALNGWTAFHAARWLPWDQTPNPEYWSPGYIGPISSDWSGYWVQIDLPLGASVDHIYILVYDNDAGASWDLSFTAYEGGEGAIVPDIISLASGSTGGPEMPGYDRISLDLTGSPVVIREWFDLSGDGFTNMLGYGLQMNTSGAADPNQMRFFGAGVRWSRTITPEPGSATFGDVPLGSFGFQHVEALADSGITAGCGGGNFCPNSTLTRVEMAIFLAKALGLHWID